MAMPVMRIRVVTMDVRDRIVLMPMYVPCSGRNSFGMFMFVVDIGIGGVDRYFALRDLFARARDA